MQKFDKITLLEFERSTDWKEKKTSSALYKRGLLVILMNGINTK